MSHDNSCDRNVVKESVSKPFESPVAMTHDEHDSNANPMELQEEPEIPVLPNVGFFPEQGRFGCFHEAE